MKRGYIIYPIVIGALLLTPSNAYDWRRGIVSRGTETNPDSNRHRGSKRINKWIHQNKGVVSKTLRKLGKRSVDVIAPGVGTGLDKAGEYGIRGIQKGQQRGNIFSPGIRNSDYRRRRR